MRKMRLKNKKSKNYLFVFLVFVVLGLYFNFKDIIIENENKEFVDKILYTSNSHLVKKNNNDVIYNLIAMVSNIELENPVSIIDNTFINKEEKIVDTMEFSYIQNTVVDNPRVYIYSTHPNENYSDGFNVVEASLILQEKLNAIGIQTIVEPRNTVSYMKENYISNSYSASRVFLKDALEDYDYDLIIDLHRDQVSSNISTKVEINGKSYAKVMFVMNTNYKDNYAFAEKINGLIYNKYPTLTRGIYNKYVDSFNQDLSSKAVLIELGSTQNNYEEVNNSIEILVETIKELLNEG